MGLSFCKTSDKPRAKKGHNMKTFKKEKISEQVSEEIKKLIHDEHFQPGDVFFSEHELCNRLGVSRSSIREALRSLEATGWVTVKQGKGTFVASSDIHENEGFIKWLRVNRESVEEHFEVRLMLDPKAAEYAGRNAVEADIKELDYLCAEFRETAKRGDIPALISIDEQFHYAIAKSTKNKTLSLLMKTMAKSLPVGWISSLHVPGRIEKTITEHSAIVDAIRHHDPQQAEKLMIQHLVNAKNEIIALIDEKEI